MNEKKYSILRQDRRMKGFIYEVFVDDLAGFDEFTFDQAENILPGTTVDIADLKRVFRLRNDREWEEYQNYSEPDDPAVDDEAAVAAILDELVSDDDIADLIGEESEGYAE